MGGGNGIWCYIKWFASFSQWKKCTGGGKAEEKHPCLPCCLPVQCKDGATGAGIRQGNWIPQVCSCPGPHGPAEGTSKPGNGPCWFLTAHPPCQAGVPLVREWSTSLTEQSVPLKSSIFCGRGMVFLARREMLLLCHTVCFITNTHHLLTFIFLLIRRD